MLRPSCPYGAELPTPHRGVVKLASNRSVVLALVEGRAEIVPLQIAVNTAGGERTLQWRLHRRQPWHVRPGAEERPRGREQAVEVAAGGIECGFDIGYPAPARTNHALDCEGRALTASGRRGRPPAPYRRASSSWRTFSMKRFEKPSTSAAEAPAASNARRT